MAVPYFELLLEFDDSSKVFRSAAFRTDAELIAQVPEAEFEGALGRVDAASGFLSNRMLTALLKDAVTAGDQRLALQKFFGYFARNRQVRGESADKYAQQVTAEILVALGDKVGADAKDVLSQRLPRLLGVHTALDRQVKAEALLRKAGRRALSVELVSDLRPVFDETRGSVEGMIPITTLRVAPAGSLVDQPFEVQLSARQLRELVEKATLALKKLATLKTHLNASSVLVPESAMTSDDEEEERDE